ncbi:MAG TPA: MFS transporter [Candidatus Limnocylindrales bacterium]|nr:MFS transporter [Candidatus Limnocylindrales bacterium]
MTTQPATPRPDVSAGPPGMEETPAHIAPAAPAAGPFAGESGPGAEAMPASLRKNRDFMVVLFGQGISSFGDSISNTAMPILVLALTGSGFAMGIVGVLSTLPDLIIGLPAGAYADRWDRRRMMLGADLGRALLTALVPVSVWLGGPTLLVIIAVAFPLNVLRVLWLAAYTAAVPGLVGRDQVPRANGIFEAVFNIGWIVGPALAGLLAGAIGPGPTIAIDALTFLISAAALLLVRRPLRPEARAEQTHILEDVREGIRYVVRQPTLRAVIGLWTMMQVISAGLTSALIFYLQVDRGYGSETVGLVLSAFAIGSLGGALLAARLSPKAVGWVMLLGAAGFGVSLVIAVGASVPVIAIVGLLAGILNANVLVAYVSLRTLLSPDALLGRVGATARTVSVGMMPIGSLVAGIALDAAGGGSTLMVMGLLLIATAGAFALVPAVRRARLAG